MMKLLESLLPCCGQIFIVTFDVSELADIHTQGIPWLQWSLLCFLGDRKKQKIIWDHVLSFLVSLIFVRHRLFSFVRRTFADRFAAVLIVAMIPASNFSMITGSSVFLRLTRSVCSSIPCLSDVCLCNPCLLRVTDCDFKRHKVQRSLNKWTKWIAWFTNTKR